MGIFGWSYPPGAANDPFAPYNQDFDDSDPPKIHWDIRKLVRGLVGNDGLARFAKACYKGSKCGVSVGFVIDNPDNIVWDTDKLYDYGRFGPWALWHEHTFLGICVSGYVEGSDVEMEPVYFEEDVSSDIWFQTIEEIDNEAEFYWIRDNSDWFYVDYQPPGQKESTRFYGRFLDEVHWESEDIPKYVVDKVSRFFEDVHDYEIDMDIPIALCLRIHFYYDSSTY